MRMIRYIWNLQRRQNIFWVRAVISAWWIFSKIVFEGSLIEEGNGAGKAIFKEGFKFAASEARNKLDSAASAVQIDEDRYVYQSTKEYQKIEGKLMED